LRDDTAIADATERAHHARCYLLYCKISHTYYSF
jgi:hypothetical protein